MPSLPNIAEIGNLTADDTDQHGYAVRCFNTPVGLRNSLFPRCFTLPKYNGSSLQDRKVQFSRITINPRQMGGVPCIRELRIPVATVLDMVAEGMETPEILKAYPDLEAEDIREALRFAAEA